MHQGLDLCFRFDCHQLSRILQKSWAENLLVWTSRGKVILIHIENVQEQQFMLFYFGSFTLTVLEFIHV